MAAEIVQDDDIAGRQSGEEALFHIGEEAGAVDRAIEDTGGGKAVTPEGRHERQRLPVAMPSLLQKATLPPWALKTGARLDFYRRRSDRGESLTDTKKNKPQSETLSKRHAVESMISTIQMWEIPAPLNFLKGME